MPERTLMSLFLTTQTEPAFKTTYGFNANASSSSFPIPAHETLHKPPLPRPPAVLLPRPPPEIAALSASPTLISNRGRQDHGSWQIDEFKPMASSAPGPRAAIENTSVGWKGLLEASRNTGHSGIIRPTLVGVSNDEADLKGTLKVKAIAPSVEVCATLHPNASIRRLVKSVSRGLTAEQEPEAALEGMGGTYFMCNENGRKVAILKPCDEEPLAPNNPKGEATPYNKS